jgi:hypothetical protein
MSINLDLGPRVRVGVDRFQSAGADMGVNFRRDDARVAEQPPLTHFAGQAATLRDYPTSPRRSVENDWSF